MSRKNLPKKHGQAEKTTTTFVSKTPIGIVGSTKPRVSKQTKHRTPKKPMRILLSQDVFARLEAARVVVDSQEFSGFGFVNVHNSEQEIIFEVYDVVLLDVGSASFTEISAEKILPLLERSDVGKMKCWLHRHPLGSATPGPHNWSGTDNHTAEKEPLGGIPELVKWSISIVRTPHTWVGRFDKYKDGKVLTSHIPVEYGVEKSFIATVKKLYKEYLERLRIEALNFPLQLPAAKKPGSRVLSFLVGLKTSLEKRIFNPGRKNG